MKIATWNIGSGININSYTEELFDIAPAAKTDDSVMEIIAKQIKDNNIDVIALQEVITTESFKYIETLSKKTGMKYFVTYENSPCHLVKNTMFGVAILSKYPLEVVKEKLYENPHLLKQTEKGTYTTHDKGYILAKVLSDKPFYISCTQILPFHRFNADILDYKQITEEFQQDNIKYNAICCGDFNVIDGVTKIKKVFTLFDGLYEPTFDDITTIDGKRCDNIFVPKDIEVKNKKLFVNDLSSDHYMCMIEI